MRRWRTAFGAVALAGLLFVVSVACSRGSATLEGTRWRLIAWTLSSLDPSAFVITAEFSRGQISGQSGVNSYGGPCKVGPGKAFAVGELAGTLMAGAEPAMRAESAYLMLLSQARSYQMADGRLTLYDAGGQELLIFEAANG